MRMRTIDQCAAYIKEQDAGTSLSKNALRTLISDGTIPSVRIGVKFLVDLDTLDTVLLAGTYRPAPPVEKVNGMTAIQL